MLGDHSVGGFPEWFVAVDRRMIGLVPMPLIVFLVLAVATAFLLHKTTFGRVVYAIGTNEQAARFSGLRVDRVKLMVFGLSGLMSGLGAVMMLSRLESARYDFANGAELTVITAVVVGGADIFGGRGTIFGTVAALFLLGILGTGMDLKLVAPEKQMAVVGSLLILAVVLANLMTRWRRGARRA
jgi:rhamnose transport system permease protein